MKLQFTYGRLPPGLTLKDPATLVATWFGSGLVPFASGTWGTLAALPFAWAIWSLGGWNLLALATLCVSALGIWAADAVSTRTGVKDAGFVVVDEVAGMWLTLLAAPFTPAGWIAAFVLFRIADILKPFPAGWADRSVRGGLGVMLDDLLAALWSALAVWLLATYGPLETAFAQ
ncbi:MAG: phosphatidylglycerophosphatase A [Rhodospirillales bacterium]|nr:phosphatidylglycerophosphatase A [Rhodospirillales bacterium]